MCTSFLCIDVPKKHFSLFVGETQWYKVASISTIIHTILLQAIDITTHPTVVTSALWGDCLVYQRHSSQVYNALPGYRNDFLFSHHQEFTMAIEKLQSLPVRPLIFRNITDAPLLAKVNSWWDIPHYVKLLDRKQLNSRGVLVSPWMKRDWAQFQVHLFSDGGLVI